ncbi:hypothetical protein O181_022114 [Austropuccinia psidii MF-1]|uniref:Uncharacterized protein n=1 Tax=Austropuccinia psidii MF-1 TaxID=1389203 RepID=A0A9Q3CC04_9BASI|nr:hypothetical protein [Austropuccinia psidii MF-1]
MLKAASPSWRATWMSSPPVFGPPKRAQLVPLLIHQIHISKSNHASSLQSLTSNMKDISHTAKQESEKTLESIVDAISGSKKTVQDGELHGAPKGTASGSEAFTDLKSINSLLRVVPRGAMLFGAAGLVPYFATSITTVYLARQAFLSGQSLPARFDAQTALTLLYHNESLQVAYGAVILSFLGAIHWGMEFATRDMNITQTNLPKDTQRYWLGILPVALAWPTLLLPGQLALATQWAAFTVVWYADMLATGWGWTPRWYSTYRFGLTAIVGSSILVTLGATNYWATDDSGYSTTKRKLQTIRENEYRDYQNTENPALGSQKVEGVIKGDHRVGSVSGEKAFVKITDVATKRKEQMTKENQQKH